jgi:hypothetical protein
MQNYNKIMSLELPKMGMHNYNKIMSLELPKMGTATTQSQQTEG